MSEATMKALLDDTARTIKEDVSTIVADASIATNKATNSAITTASDSLTTQFKELQLICNDILIKLDKLETARKN